MSPEITIRMLLTSRREEPLAPEEWKRVKARCAYALDLVARCFEAERRCTEAWGELVKDIPEEEIDDVEIPPPPEQAEVDALWAELDALTERDVWPRHLHCHGV